MRAIKSVLKDFKVVDKKRDYNYRPGTKMDEDVGNKTSNAIIRGGHPSQPLPPSFGGGPPPPPPLISGGGPPPSFYPAGGPPPPPPPPQVTVLPHGMKPKKIYNNGKRIKTINWIKVNVNHLDKDSLWVKANEEKFESSDLIKDLVNIFSTETVTKDSNDAQEKKPAKKGKELKVLDPKAGQNLSILLRSIKIPYNEIKQHILEMDEENLTPTLIEQLIKYMPEEEKMNQLAGMKDQYAELAEVEQFAVTMSSIKRLVPRLKSMLFKMKFPETLSDIKSDFENAIEACEEVRNSSKFSQVLQFILLCGNILNTGSWNAHSYGFEISFLRKLQDTKSKDGKTTLMHFLAQKIKEKYPDLLNFYEELRHFDQAAQVLDNDGKKIITQMEEQLSQLEIDPNAGDNSPDGDKFVSDDDGKKIITQMEEQLSPLETDPNAGDNSPDGDKFGDVMNHFVTFATEQFEVLHDMYNKLDSLYKDLGKYFCFDPLKYTLDEFFGDIKAFKENFSQAVKDNDKLREREENIRWAKEKSKSLRGKRDEVACKKARLDMTTDENQERKRDSYMEFLEAISTVNIDPNRCAGKKLTNSAAFHDRFSSLSRSRVW